MRTIFLSIMLLMNSLSATGQNRKLSQELQKYLDKLPATTIVRFQIESINGELYAAQNEKMQVAAASTIKIPILVELMEQVKAGQLNLDDNYSILATDKTAGSGTLSAQPDGFTMSYKELARQMMINSDNTATNIFIRKLGQKNINQRMKSLGLNGLVLNRIMLDTLAAKEGRENFVNCQELNQLLRLIVQKKVANAPLCDLMMEFLFQNTDRTTLARKLPADVKVAHKTGTLTYVRGDAGIVYGSTPFVISVFVTGTSTATAEEIIGEIAYICYQNK